jgi:hypothetical protein
MDLLTQPRSADDVRQRIRFLDLHGTFHFPTLPNGLFCAATGTHADFALSGYDRVWVRDNIHIAYAHEVLGDSLAAVRNVTALLEFQRRRRKELLAVLGGTADPTEPMLRPHIRFNGITLEPAAETWSHAQNDAIGYLVWLACRLMRSGSFQPDQEQLTTLADLVHYLAKIEYWQDADSGHWEEARKIEASSIGPVVAALRDLSELFNDREWATRFSGLPRPISKAFVESLRQPGVVALARTLPWESRTGDAALDRECDSALLFLIDPLDVVDQPTADAIIHNVRTRLMGPHGIRRYLGDSYWCANYRTLLSAETRTTDFSNDMSSRDSLLRPGEEAQWCLFDPVLSVIFGRRYQRDRDPAQLELQWFHLRRSLSQLTPPDSRFGAYRCPESYFLEAGGYVPNDITPLLWTQANLRRALAVMEQSLANA